MTWLHPGCSHISLLPSMTKDGRPKVARNYEFNDAFEDFNVIKTSIQGAYTHIGTSVLGLGRDDGFNEMGLAVTMSSTSSRWGLMRTCAARPSPASSSGPSSAHCLTPAGM